MSTVRVRDDPDKKGNQRHHTNGRRCIYRKTEREITRMRIDAQARFVVFTEVLSRKT